MILLYKLINLIISLLHIYLTKNKYIINIILFNFQFEIENSQESIRTLSSKKENCIFKDIIKFILFHYSIINMIIFLELRLKDSFIFDFEIMDILNDNDICYARKLII